MLDLLKKFLIQFKLFLQPMLTSFFVFYGRISPDTLFKDILHYNHWAFQCWKQTCKFDIIHWGKSGDLLLS